LNNLKSGGLWVTEDLHCCNEPFYWGNSPVKYFKDTLLFFFQNMDDEEFIESIKETDVLFSVKSIMHLFKDVNLYENKIVFITKK
jgi:hypothetical protein